VGSAKVAKRFVRRLFSSPTRAKVGAGVKRLGSACYFLGGEGSINEARLKGAAKLGEIDQVVAHGDTHGGTHGDSHLVRSAREVAGSNQGTHANLVCARGADWNVSSLCHTYSRRELFVSAVGGERPAGIRMPGHSTSSPHGGGIAVTKE